MRILIPERKELLAKIPLFCTIAPLRRPRANWHHRGSVRSDLSNQKDLFAALDGTAPLGLEEPLYIDTIINWKHADSIPLKRRPTHAIKSRHGDLDNLSKAVNDALVKYKVIADDIFIVGQTITKTYGPEDLGAVLIWSVQEQVQEVTAWDLRYARTSC